VAGDAAGRMDAFVRVGCWSGAGLLHQQIGGELFVWSEAA